MGARARAGGYTLIETLIALAVVLIGATGMATLFTAGVRLNGDALRMTRATAIAQDLLSSIALWQYDERGALANAEEANDDDLGDGAHAFEHEATPVTAGIADHGEADLAALGAGWTGLPASALAGGYERYWNVRYADRDANGVNDLAEIAVIVRWPHGGGWRRIVLMSAKLNPRGG